MRTITDTDKLAELEREIVMRRQVYPHLIQTGRLELAEANRRAEVMEAIASDYRLRIQPVLDLGEQNES